MAAKILECRVERREATEGTVALALGGVTIGGKPAGFAGTLVVEAADGMRLQLGVSKLDGETEWIVDSFGKAGGCPAFANGYGARYCALKALTDAEQIAALDAIADTLAVTA